LGGEGNDTLKASSGGGNNRLYGGGGDDLLLGGSNDILCGGAGRDKFLLANAQLPNNSNLVLDFEVGSDLLSLSGLSIEGNPVSFNDLSFTQGDRGTQLSIPDLSPDPLAIFLGITADTLNNSFNFELS
jgi:Ca2+-binding RTX toxin-like protein